MNLDEILAAVRERPFDGYGIGLASAYVGSIGPCLADEGCSRDFFGMGSVDQWTQAVKASASRLVYGDRDMAVEAGRAKDAVPDWEVKSWGKFWKDSELTPGACLDFDHYVTSTRKDRDADVLEVSGAEPDPQAPLLWQHLPLQPIGRMLEFLPVDGNRLPGRASIIDNPLGRDAAQLLEFKALRISHGFLPLQFEPLKGDKHRDSSDPRLGWHVQRYKILEVSLVSIPSNEDAVITAWSRHKLHHPLVKAWAKSLKAHLPATVKGGWEGDQAPLSVTLQFGNGPPAGAGGTPAGVKSQGGTRAGHGKDACGCGGKCGGCAARAAALMVQGVPTVGKPYSGEHACRISDPANFSKFRRQNRKVKGGKTVGMIFGQPKGGGAWQLQAMRYPTDDWDADTARKSCAKQKGKFEAASKDALPQVKDAGVMLANRDGILMPFLAGSWEEIEADLEADAAGWLKGNGIDPQGKDLTLVGTYQGYGVVCLREYGYYTSGPRYSCYHGNWKLEDGDPEWDGAPEPVDLVVTVSPAKPDPDADQTEPAVGSVDQPDEMTAAVRSLIDKAFAKGKTRRLAKKHLTRLENARDLIGTAKGAEELRVGTRAIVEKSHHLIDGVIADVKQDPERTTTGGPGGGPMESNVGLASFTADKLTALLEKGCDLDYETAGELIARLNLVRERQEEAALAPLVL